MKAKCYSTLYSLRWWDRRINGAKNTLEAWRKNGRPAPLVFTIGSSLWSKVLKRSVRRQLQDDERLSMVIVDAHLKSLPLTFFIVDKIES